MAWFSSFLPIFHTKFKCLSISTGFRPEKPDPAKIRVFPGQKPDFHPATSMFELTTYIFAICMTWGFQNGITCPSTSQNFRSGSVTLCAERIFCQLWTHCHSNYCWIESQLCRPRVGVHSQDFLSYKRKKDQLLTPKWKLSVIYHTIGDIWWDMMANSFSLQIFYGMGFHNRCEVHWVWVFGYIFDVNFENNVHQTQC